MKVPDWFYIAVGLAWPVAVVLGIIHELNKK